MFSGRVLGVLAGAAVLALSAGGAVAQPKDKIKVGFIYVGPVGDHGWSYQHDQGRQAIEKAFPGKVTTTFVESVPEADSERAIEQLARRSEEHTSELQSRQYLVCRLLLEKKKNNSI